MNPLQLNKKLVFKKLTQNAYAPAKMTWRSAGYDLASAYDYLIEPNTRQLIFTDISLEIPVGYYGRIAGRSSFAMKGVIVAGGVIDGDYKGNIGVILINTDPTATLTIKRGDRIAQLIIEKHMESQVIWEKTKEEGQLIPYVKGQREDMRGDKGFGSTGV